MIGGTTRRLPKWLTVGDEEEEKKKKKKKKKKEEVEEQKRTEENPTPPPRKNSVPPANNGTKRKKGNLFKHDDLSRATSGNRSKRKAKDVAFHDQILDEEEEDALTVEDLVSIAREFVKGSEDSEPSMLLLSRISQPDGSSEQQFTSGETRACVGPTVNLTTEQTFPSFIIRTGDLAQDMLNLFLGPLLMKPQGNQMDLDLMHEPQRPSRDDSREETIPPAKKKSSLKDTVSFLLD